MLTGLRPVSVQLQPRVFERGDQPRGAEALPHPQRGGALARGEDYLRDQHFREAEQHCEIQGSQHFGPED